MTDIYLGADRATEPEVAAVDAALRARGVDPVVRPETERLYTSGRSRRRERRHFLLPALHALQNAVGWISPGGINYVAEVLDVPPAEAFGVATFYDLFRTEPPDHDGDTFRAVYTVRFETAVYVLHAFQKKARRGIATPKQELDLVRRRLRAAEQHYRDTHRGE